MKKLLKDGLSGIKKVADKHGKDFQIRMKKIADTTEK